MTVCGVVCESECSAFGDSCKGCRQLDGRVSWVPDIGETTCPIFTYVKESNYTSCGVCSKKPCDIWLIETKKTSVTEQEFFKDINSRLNNLRKSNSCILTKNT